MQRSEELREEFKKQLASIKPDKLFFIDEVGAENNMVPLRGWSASGERSYAEQLAFSSNRRNIVAAYSKITKDLIAPFEFTGFTNLALFTEWFRQILCPALAPGDYVILDNASFHKSDEITEIARQYKLNLLYLPPYSPDLNPIEKFWANLKRNLRKTVKRFTNFADAITHAFVITLSG